MSKQQLLLDSDYSWESSSDIEGDVNWAVESLSDQFDGGEFPGHLEVSVIWVKDD